MAKKDAQYWIDQQKAAFDEERDRHNAMGSFVAQKGIGIGPKVLPPPPELNPDGTYTKAEIERQKKMKTEVEQQTENSEGDDEGDDGGEEDDEEDDIPDLDELDEDLDPDLDLDPDEEETENAFCPGAGADDNSCPPANKGEGQEPGEGHPSGVPGPEVKVESDDSPLTPEHRAAISGSFRWKEKLSYDEYRAMDKWARFDSNEMRARISRGELEQVDKDFMGAVERAPQYQGTVFRGMSDKPGGKGPKTIQGLLSAGVGGIWTEKAPMSMTRRAEMGHEFSHGHTVLRIETKTGRAIEGAGYAGLSGGRREAEVLGLPNTQYRIKAITENVRLTHPGVEGHKKVAYLVDLEEI